MAQPVATGWRSSTGERLGSKKVGHLGIFRRSAVFTDQTRLDLTDISPLIGRASWSHCQCLGLGWFKCLWAVKKGGQCR